VPGVYLDWTLAQEQIQGIKGPKYKKFNTRAEAEAFVAQGRIKNGSLAGAQLPPEKKHKLDMINRSAPGLVLGSTYTPKDANGNVLEAGTGPLPPGVEDGFDPNVKLNATGQVVHKAEAEKTKTKFVTKERDPPGMLTIYTDGSSLRNGQAGARAGVGVFFGPGDPRYASTVSSPEYLGRTLPHPCLCHGLVPTTYTKGSDSIHLTQRSRNVSEALKGTRQTNQRAELTAIIRALDIAPLNRDVTIYTDSRYSIDCVTNWYKNWVRNKWMTAKNKPVENKDLIMDIRQKMDEREHRKSGTYFFWVKGHANDEGNTAADRLAVEGALMGKGVDREAVAAEDVEKAVTAEEAVGVIGEDSVIERAFRAIESAMDWD
jgi:ribonuclease HI